MCHIFSIWLGLSGNSPLTGAKKFKKYIIESITDSSQNAKGLKISEVINFVISDNLPFFPLAPLFMADLQTNKTFFSSFFFAFSCSPFLTFLRQLLTFYWAYFQFKNSEKTITE